MMAARTTARCRPEEAREQPMSHTITAVELGRVQELLRNQLRSQVRDVCIVLHEGNKVVLQGVARSYYAKQMAQHLLLGAVGTMTLVNEIAVRRVTPEPELDAP
jgi:hypothetical protein